MMHLGNGDMENNLADVGWCAV